MASIFNTTKNDKINNDSKHDPDIAKLNASSAQSRAVLSDLNSRKHSGFNVETVRRDDNVTDLSKNAGVITTGAISQTEIDARKAEAIRRTLAGEPPLDAVSVDEQIAEETRKLWAIEEALEFVLREREKEMKLRRVAYAKSKKDSHDADMVTLGKAAIAFHAALLPLYELKQHLVDNSVGLHGLCLILPEFMSHPGDKWSESSAWFHAMKKEGFIAAVPKELR